MTAQMERIALANPQAAFSLYANGRRAMQLEAESAEDRIKALMPKDFKEACRPVSAESDGWKLTGLGGASHHFSYARGRSIPICQRPLHSRSSDEPCGAGSLC